MQSRDRFSSTSSSFRDTVIDFASSALLTSGSDFDRDNKEPSNDAITAPHEAESSRDKNNQFAYYFNRAGRPFYSQSSSASFSNGIVDDNNGYLTPNLPVDNLDTNPVLQFLSQTPLFTTTTTPPPIFSNSASRGDFDVVLRWPASNSTSTDLQPHIGYFHQLYCNTLQRHGFHCNDEFAASFDDIAGVCSNAEPKRDDRCVDSLVYNRMSLDNMNLFYVYLSFATPLVLVALVFNAIALASIVTMTNRLSRHFLLVLMSFSDTIVSLSAFLRRIDGTVMGGQGQVWLIAVWQFSWLLSALSLLGLSIDMFISLVMPYHYDRPVMKRAVISAIFIGIGTSMTIVGLLAYFGVQESDNSQYFACAILLVIITVMCASYIYGCISAEIVNLKIQRSQASLVQNNSTQVQNGDTNNYTNSSGCIQHPKAQKLSSSNRTILRKSVVTTSLLIVSSLLSWIPMLVYFLISESTKESNVPLFIRLLTFCLICFHFNAVINPLIYSFRFRDVRSSLKRLFRKSACYTCFPVKMRDRLMSFAEQSTSLQYPRASLMTRSGGGSIANGNNQHRYSTTLQLEGEDNMSPAEQCRLLAVPSNNSVYGQNGPVMVTCSTLREETAAADAAEDDGLYLARKSRSLAPSQNNPSNLDKTETPELR